MSIWKICSLSVCVCVYVPFKYELCFTRLVKKKKKLVSFIYIVSKNSMFVRHSETIL